MSRLQNQIPADVKFLPLMWEYTRPVIAAFAIFGFYRFWLGIIEGSPKFFYVPEQEMEAAIPKEYWHVEPTFRHKWSEHKGPVVDLAEGAAALNLYSAVFYVAVASAALLIPSMV